MIVAEYQAKAQNRLKAMINIVYCDRKMKWKSVLILYILFFSLSAMNVKICHAEDSFVTFENETDFTVVNLTFDNVGIYVLNCSRFVIANNVFVNVEYAIRIAIYAGQICESFVIANNTFIGSEGTKPLVILLGSPSERGIRNFLIVNNTLMSSQKIGVRFAENGIIASNKIINSSHGIATRGVSNITIEGNFIENCSGYGIYLGTQIGDFGTNNVTIKNNLVIANNVGIARWYGSYPIKDVGVKDNQFINNTMYDIEADFPVTFVNNIITSKSKLRVVDTGSKFIGTKSILGESIQPGDLNDDGKIDMRDIGAVACAYGSCSGDPRWNPMADIIDDEVVNMKDLGFAASYFGFCQ